MRGPWKRTFEPTGSSARLPSPVGATCTDAWTMKVPAALHQVVSWRARAWKQCGPGSSVRSPSLRTATCTAARPSRPSTPPPWRTHRDRERHGGGSMYFLELKAKAGVLMVTASGKAVALGGVGPRHARRPEAADRWPPVVSAWSLVTERALADPMKHRSFPPGHAWAGRARWPEAEDGRGGPRRDSRRRSLPRGHSWRERQGDPAETAAAVRFPVVTRGESAKGTPPRQPPPFASPWSLVTESAKRGPRRDSRRRSLPGWPLVARAPRGPRREHQPA
jgi:hypothetical protein